MKQKYGWVLERYDGGFLNDTYTGYTELKEASVYQTRNAARNSKLPSDHVRRVSLDSDGEPITIIKGR